MTDLIARAVWSCCLTVLLSVVCFRMLCWSALCSCLHGWVGWSATRLPCSPGQTMAAAKWCQPGCICHHLSVSCCPRQHSVCRAVWAVRSTHRVGMAPPRSANRNTAQFCLSIVHAGCYKQQSHAKQQCVAPGSSQDGALRCAVLRCAVGRGAQRCLWKRFAVCCLLCHTVCCWVCVLGWGRPAPTAFGCHILHARWCWLWVLGLWQLVFGGGKDTGCGGEPFNANHVGPSHCDANPRGHQDL
jgi:hypothetical protein